MRAHDAGAERQPDARPFAEGLGREERLENPLADFLRHARAVVRHGDLNLPSEAIEPGRDPDVPWRGGRDQRLPCVGDQIH